MHSFSLQNVCIADLSFSVPTSIHLQVSNSYVHTPRYIFFPYIDSTSVIHEVKKHVKSVIRITKTDNKAIEELKKTAVNDPPL